MSCSGRCVRPSRAQAHCIGYAPDVKGVYRAPPPAGGHRWFASSASVSEPQTAGQAPGVHSVRVADSDGSEALSDGCGS
jgi:hypothetical protein